MIRGWHSLDVGQELKIDLSPEDIRKVLEQLSQPPYLYHLTTVIYTYNSTPPVISPLGFVQYDTQRRRWHQVVNPNWKNKRIAILLHGMLSNIRALNDLAETLQNYAIYDEIWGFDYDWTRNIRENGETFANHKHKRRQHDPDRYLRTQYEGLSGSMGTRKRECFTLCRPAFHFRNAPSGGAYR